MNIEITATADAWINTIYNSIDGIAKFPPERAINLLTFYNGNFEVEGYAKVGTATITFTSFDDAQIKCGMIESMKIEISKIRAESTVKINEIEEKIQQLLALPNLSKGDIL